MKGSAVRIRASALLVVVLSLRQSLRRLTRPGCLRKTPTMELDRRRLKEQIHELYRTEHEAVGERGTLERLERGR